MGDADFYHTIDRPSVAEFKDRGSKFIAYAYPLGEVAGFKEKLAALKKEHPKAAHHCFAYRIGTEGNNFRLGDGGEPPGSAGRPLLGQIDSKELTNVLVIVVRYFGGSLLGVPGLINAYKTVTAEALRATGIIQQPVLIQYRLQFDYTQLNEVMKLVKQFDCVVIKKDIQLFCSMELGVPKANHGGWLLRLKEIKSVEMTRH